MSRRNDGQDIYLNDADRDLFLETISEMAERFEADIFAYVLMSNHYHLLVRTNRANLKKAMQWFGTTFTRRFNNRNLKSGHLFQGRYKSILVQNDIDKCVQAKRLWPIVSTEQLRIICPAMI